MLKRIASMVLLSVLSALSLSAQAQDTYDGAVLTIPKVAVGQTLYRDVKITVGQIVANCAC
jgi:hypothetical protein